MEEWKNSTMGERLDGGMEGWNDGRMVMTIGSFPIIPTFHHSNLPVFALIGFIIGKSIENFYNNAPKGIIRG